MRVTYISWAPYCSRSDNTARELGGTSYMVYWGWLGSHPLTILPKYIGQTFETWRRLVASRPEAVFVMSPPIFAVVVAWLYTKVAGVPLVIDAHTAAFLHPRWARWQWLQHAMGRRAATTIVTNDHLRTAVEQEGGHATIVRDVPVVFPRGGRFERSRTFTVAVVCSFNYDEPVEAIFAAAAAVPDVEFRVTGDPRFLDSKLREALPPNARLTGFLPDADYGALLAGVDAVLTFTTRDHTMLRAAYEAIYQGTPVIVSDTPLLRAAFDDGAIHVDNTAEGIAAAVTRMAADHDRYRQGAGRLRTKKLGEWVATRDALAERVSGRTVSASR